VIYNLEMDDDTKLKEFLAVLGRIKELLEEVSISDDEDLDLDKAIEQLRQSGNDKDADELAGLVEQAENMKAAHQAEA
jgi:hypothetical protein